jgi:hypothetical protein
MSIVDNIQIIFTKPNKKQAVNMRLDIKTDIDELRDAQDSRYFLKFQIEDWS